MLGSTATDRGQEGGAAVATPTSVRYPPAMDADRLLEVVARMNDEGVEYVLVGAAALTVHGIVRATEDADFCVRPTPENVERLRRALRRVWDDPHIDEITAEDLCGDYPAIAYGPPDGSLPLDIMTRLGEAVRYDDLEAQQVVVGGVPVRVATPRTLYRLKRDAGRPQDRVDASVLRQHFDVGDD